MSQIEYIRKYAGQIIGTIETDSNGVKTAKKWAGPILGVYNPRTNETTEFAGKIIAHGDVTSALVWNSVK